MVVEVIFSWCFGHRWKMSRYSLFVLVHREEKCLSHEEAIHHVWIGRGKILLNDLILSVCLYVYLLSH